MSESRPGDQRRALAVLTREARLSAPLLRELTRAFEGGDWVDPGSLGTFYEAELSQSKELQRGQGSYFTPRYLVDFVVEHTLGAIVEGRTPKQIAALRIMDPSCGGGAFLLGVLRYLELHCLRGGARSGPALRRKLSGCLVGVDLDAEALEVSRAALHLAVGGEARATLVLGDALLPETALPRLDAIVGNPPWGQKGLKLSPVARARYKELFVTARGVWDPCKFFVERAHQLLRDNAPWGYVLPDIVLLKNLQEVRDVVLEGSAISEIAHCGQAFAGANIDAIAICGTRTKSPVPEDHRLRVWPALKADWQTVAPKTHEQEQAVFRELPGHTFNLYLHGASLEMYRRLRSLPRLGSETEMHEGVHTGNARGKLFMDAKGAGAARKIIVGGSEMRRFGMSWKGRWLNLNPLALDRDAGDYANVGNAAWHGRNKVVVRRTGDRVVAAFDSRGYYVSNNLFVLFDGRTGPEAVQRRRALVALLNSRFMTWYFRAIVPRRGRLFAELKLVHLRDFPLPSPERFAAVEAELAALTRKGARRGEASVSAEVNALVESAYELSPRELEVIRLSE